MENLKQGLEDKENQLASFQFLINESLEESVKKTLEIRFLRNRTLKLEQQIAAMTRQENTTICPPSSSYMQMCKDYEERLKILQQTLNLEKRKNEQEKQNVIDMRAELQKESALRCDLGLKWKEQKEEHKAEIKQLREHLEQIIRKMENINKEFDDSMEKVKQELQSLKRERDEASKMIKQLQDENHMLCGRYLTNSQLRENEIINLPQDIQSHEEVVLKLQQGLILAKTGSEDIEKKYKFHEEEASKLRLYIKQPEVKNEKQIRKPGLHSRRRFSVEP